MSNTSDIEEGEIPDQESLAIPTSSKNSKPIPKRKPDRPYDSDSSASSEQASSDDSDNEWWDRKKVKGEKGSQDSDNEDSDGDVIEITEANPNYFKKGNWKSKRDFNRDDINARKGFHKKKMGAMQDKVGFKRTFQAAKANRRAFPPGSPPKVAMYPCKFYIVFGKCDDPNCKNVHAPLTRDDEMQRFIAENEEFFADIAKRRQELNLSGFLLKLLTDKFGPPQPQIGNPPPSFGMNRPLPPPKAQMQPAPYLPPNQGPPPMGNFNNYPPGSNFPNMPARPPGMPHQGPPPSYMPPQNGPQPMMHNMPPQDPRFGQNPNMPPRNPGFEYPPQPQQNFAFAPTYRPPNPNPNPNQMFGNQFQQEPKLNFGQEQIKYPPQNNQGYDYNQGHNQGLNQGPPHAQQQHGNFNPYQPQYPQQQHQQQQPQQPPVNMNQMNRAPGQEDSQSGFMNPPIPGAGNMGPPNVGVQGQGTFMMPTNNYQVEPRFQEQNIFSNVGNFPAQVQQNVQQNPQSTGNNGLQEGQGAVKGSSPTEAKGAGENEEEPKRAAMNDIEKFNEKMKNFGILNFGGSGTGSGNVEKEDTKADEELQRQIKEAIREETKGVDGAGLSGNISINDQILKQIKSVLPQFQSQSPDNIKNLVNIYLKLSKDPRLQNRIQS